MSSVGKYFSGCYTAIYSTDRRSSRHHGVKTCPPQSSTIYLQNPTASRGIIYNFLTFWMIRIIRCSYNFHTMQFESTNGADIRCQYWILRRVSSSTKRFFGLGKIENIGHLKLDCLIKQFNKNSRNVKYFSTSFWHVIISISHLKSCFNTLPCLHLLKHIYLNIVIWWLWAE